MKVLSDLAAGGVTETEARPAGGGIAWVSSEPRAGLIRRVTLSPAGVWVERAGAGVLVPLEELMRVCEAAEPVLAGTVE
jgi:hypothetical protein